MEFTLSICIEGFGMTNGFNSCHSESDLTQSETVVSMFDEEKRFKTVLLVTVSEPLLDAAKVLSKYIAPGGLIGTSI